jgi:hypothetical protein
LRAFGAKTGGGSSRSRRFFGFDRCLGASKQDLLLLWAMYPCGSAFSSEDYQSIQNLIPLGN